jgi:hypothetical protein
MSADELHVDVSEGGQIQAANDHALDLLAAEIDRQDEIHPAGYPATRDGIRFGLATVEDELKETLDAWRAERRTEGWTDTEEELTQTAAVSMRLLRSLLLDRANGQSD